MCQQHNRREGQTSKSSTYAMVKGESMIATSIRQKGKAHYRDSNGEQIYYLTTDSRVLSGELISLSKGRKISTKTERNARDAFMLAQQKFAFRTKSLSNMVYQSIVFQMYSNHEPETYDNQIK